jgi:hypothetical protein
MTSRPDRECRSCGFPSTCGTDNQGDRVCTQCAVDTVREGGMVTWDEDAPQAIVDLAGRALREAPDDL